MTSKKTSSAQKSQNAHDSQGATTRHYDFANFQQTREWAKVNEQIGHKVVVKKIAQSSEKGAREIDLVMIIKSAKRARYLEIPCGPLIDFSDQKIVEKTFAHIRAVAKTHRCAFIRFRPQLLDTPENRKALESLGAKIAPMHLAASHTVMIDLTKSEDDLLKSMRRQTRYEVRKAEKQGIVVEKSTDENAFRGFFKVQQETASRQHFVPPSLDELLAEHNAFGENAVIYVAKTAPENPDAATAKTAPESKTTSAAKVENAKSAEKPIAYGLIIKSGVEADYYEAASTDLNRKLPGAYALQWAVMRDLKAEGYERYNLWGIAPDGAKNHRYSGVTIFKTGFGGEKISFVPAFDLVLSPVRYAFNLLIETIRKRRRRLS